MIYEGVEFMVYKDAEFMVDESVEFMVDESIEFMVDEGVERMMYGVPRPSRARARRTPRPTRLLRVTFLPPWRQH